MVTVVVPIYNVERWLDRCVTSIVNQTYQELEIILVDDGSPDNCGEICDEYAKLDKRVVVIHQSNGGLSAARNTGIDWTFKNSDAEWLFFVDSDDAIASNTLS
jgi:glycosyltransferase involved in cell wall biosynthesis